MSETIHKVIIIGGGCAGLTAAIYCGRAELKPVLFAGSYEKKGGLLMKTSIVENYPGFPNGVSGFDLMFGMEEQAIKYGTEMINNEIVELDVEHEAIRLVDSDGITYLTQTLIVCTGSEPNKLGLTNEEKLWTSGISSCAVCDGALYKNKKIIVVGGGDSAIEEALFLTKFSDVVLIHRRDKFRASKIMQDRLFANSKVKIIYNTVITELVGDEHLEKIICTDVNDNHNFTLEVDGLFYGLGLKPNTELFKNILDVDADGYIIADPESGYKTMTSVRGIFVAGDATDKIYRQAVVACGNGCEAALDVERYLATIE
jgi:thioredoxin reductase (NADPH)